VILCPLKIFRSHLAYPLDGGIKMYKKWRT